MRLTLFWSVLATASLSATGALGARAVAASATASPSVAPSTPETTPTAAPAISPNPASPEATPAAGSPAPSASATAAVVTPPALTVTSIEVDGQPASAAPDASRSTLDGTPARLGITKGDAVSADVEIALSAHVALTVAGDSGATVDLTPGTTVIFHPAGGRESVIVERGAARFSLAAGTFIAGGPQFSTSGGSANFAIAVDDKTATISVTGGDLVARRSSLRNDDPVNNVLRPTLETLAHEDAVTAGHAVVYRLQESSSPEATANLQQTEALAATSAPAAFEAGASYLLGSVVDRDEAKALHYLDLAAGAGSLAAKIDLGADLASAAADAPSPLAREYFLAASATGDAVATNDLGVVTDRKDPKAALALFERAAASDDAAAEYNVGYHYYVGRGVTEDDKIAFRWFRLAAAHGFAGAERQLGHFYLHGYGVRKDERAALVWFGLAALQDDPIAQDAIGVMYEEGRGVSRDLVKAATYYRASADLGDPYGEAYLAQFYFEGHGVRRSYERARHWYGLSAAAGNAIGENGYGYLYDLGYGVGQNFTTARRYYTLAAAQDDSAALVNLGYLYEHGRGVVRDYGTALHYYRRAAAQDDATAYYHVGYMYETGEVGAKDDQAAEIYYHLAAARGSDDAAVSLAGLAVHGKGTLHMRGLELAWLAIGNALGGDADSRASYTRALAHASTADRSYARLFVAGFVEAYRTRFGSALHVAL